jgi:hypothetical protein
VWGRIHGTTGGGALTGAVGRVVGAPLSSALPHLSLPFPPSFSCRILKALGMKPLIISFLRREEDDVKQQALLAASKLLVNRWQFVSGGGGGGGVGGGTPKA